MCVCVGGGGGGGGALLFQYTVCCYSQFIPCRRLLEGENDFCRCLTELFPGLKVIHTYMVHIVTWEYGSTPMLSSMY